MSALLGGLSTAMLLAAPALAADPAPPAGIGPPTPLLPASPPPSGKSLTTTPAHSAPAPPPEKRVAGPVLRIPLDAKPLIPPAAVPAKLNPLPDPRPALSLETDLEPLGPAEAAPSQPGSPGTAAPPAARSPSS